MTSDDLLSLVSLMSPGNQMSQPACACSSRRHYPCSQVSSGNQMGKERAASALWHLSVDAVNQVTIAKAGGIAPLVQAC